ncbi:hypothetical protein GW17_00008112 [Ensete ventricosum]|nr:hypothetical protein GW17_00008112 [Ensete ventricosum]RZR94532.1 hypothetical protein BHM03_00023224 [Ensete ventricosum]
MSNTTLPRAQTAIYNQSLNKRNIGRRPFRQPPSGHIRWPTSTRKLKSDLRPVALYTYREDESLPRGYQKREEKYRSWMTCRDGWRSCRTRVARGFSEGAWLSCSRRLPRLRFPGGHLRRKRARQVFYAT